MTSRPPGILSRGHRYRFVASAALIGLALLTDGAARPVRAEMFGGFIRNADGSFVTFDVGRPRAINDSGVVVGVTNNPGSVGFVRDASGNAMRFDTLYPWR